MHWQHWWLMALLAFSMNDCSNALSNKRLDSFAFEPSLQQSKDSVTITYTNSLACPGRFYVYTNFPDTAAVYTGNNPHLVEGFATLNLTFPRPETTASPPFSYGFALGQPQRVRLDSAGRYAFPFPKGKSYKIVQGYNGDFSHDNDGSRYAIDFGLAVGDTVCAALDGVVVGVIDGYTQGGNDRRYRDYANFITLYHANGTLTQYVHLKKNGSLVVNGDTVRAGQPIGLAGMTGFTSVPHVHFNVLRPAGNTNASFPVQFEKAKGEDLKAGSWVSH